MGTFRQLLLAGLAVGTLAFVASGSASAQVPKTDDQGASMMFGTSYQNDVSLPLYYLPAWNGEKKGEAREAAANPKVPNHHVDAPDTSIQRMFGPTVNMPAPINNFDGIGFPGVGCNCAPPDTNGEVGETQYMQIVNEGYQIFDKTSGASIAGPSAISSLWAGFGGVCETGGAGDPVVLYDQLAKRWLISQFAGGSTITDECIAVSTTSDATGSYNRYGFHLGTNFFDYPHLGVWPDGYYMSMNVFNAAGTAYLGPQAFAFDRNAMMAGNPATFIASAALGKTADPILPADLDGANPPPIGAPNPFVEFPGSGKYKVFRFHADFATPANSTFALAGSPNAAHFTSLCASGRACVPQSGGVAADNLDGLGDRLMFRLAYRNFGDHEALVGNYSVSASSVAGVRWFELRSATTGTPSVFQESTYQPDTTWRWMGSAAMDRQGNLALGYSASDASTNPQLRYAGRLASDPLNTLPQGESHLFDGSGHQIGTGNRWGDYSDMTVDPVDDCTFWYTNEYYSTTGSFSWKTRIGSFKFPSCSPPPGFDLTTVPSSANVCAGTSANFTINAASISGFSGAVTLSGSGNPAPSTLAFSPNPIPSTPGASTLTIDTTGVATGAYPIEIDGTATGAAAQLTNLELDVSAAAPVAPTLLSPADTASIPALRPTFSWTGSDTQSYTIEVASDVAFANIVFTQTLTGTSVSMTTDLLANSTYFWRVTPTNICGTGATSAVFTFSTQNAVCSSPGAPIPDNNATGVSDSLVISDPSVVNSLQVYVKARHTWVGDLAFKLTKSAASSILIDRPGVPASTYGCSGDNVDVLLDDAAGTLVENQCNPTPPAIGGTQKPNNPINSVFAGSSFAGTWTLTASDAVAGDTGTFDEWCLVAQLAPPTYTVGGTVNGLAGSLVLSLNAGAQTLPISADGSFTFPTGLTSGSSYAVTVGTQPSTQTCTVSNGGGTIAGANVTDVSVTCTTNTYTVGGTVTGLAGGSVTLQNNGTDTVTVSADGPFTFPALADGSSYAVTVLTQPSGLTQTCTVTNGSGSLAGANVTNVSVACVTNTYTVGGIVNGLSGSGLMLSLNSGAQTFSVSANGAYTFPTPLVDGSAYAVIVSTQPGSPSQTCTVSNGSGVIAGANVTNVNVTCTTSTYTVGGHVTGLTGGSVTLQINGGETVTVSVNGQFTFLPLADGSAYDVTVFAQPTTPAQTCTVTNGSGNVAGADVTNITVTCVVNTYSIGGTVSGLLGSGLVLQLNGGSDLPISADGTFTFGQFANGTTYVVTVSTQPSGPVEVCTVSNGSGTLAGADSAIVVTCDDTIFKNGFD